MATKEANTDKIHLANNYITTTYIYSVYLLICLTNTIATTNYKYLLDNNNRS